MKKTLLTLSLMVTTLTMQAQNLLIYDDGYIKYALSDIERITYEEDPYLLPNVIANDPKTSIFGEALKATGLADSIKTSQDKNSLINTDSPQGKDSLYSGIFVRFQNLNDSYTLALWRERVPTRFTAFVEPDSVFAEHGIKNLEDLKNYAKQVYDEVFPEDASITDLTNRHNSLNRFVAYHLLPFGTSYGNLAGTQQAIGRGNFIFDRKDPTSFYATMMPEGSLKVSSLYWSNFLYLNRRGLAENATVKGIQVEKNYLVDEPSYISNGAYYYIDDLLTYDKQTQEEVLTDRWTIDLKRLSPSLMNIAFSVREDRLTCLKPELCDNIIANASIAYMPYHTYFNSYEGDNVTFLDFEHATIKLPPLPQGEWQVRIGCTSGGNKPVFRTYIDNVMQRDTVDCRIYYYAEQEEFEKGIVEHGPDFYGTDSDHPLSNNAWNVSHLAGIVKSDGRQTHYLRLESLIYGPEIQASFDYIEFVPINKQ